MHRGTFSHGPYPTREPRRVRRRRRCIDHSWIPGGSNSAKHAIHALFGDAGARGRTSGSRLFDGDPRGSGGPHPKRRDGRRGRGSRPHTQLRFNAFMVGIYRQFDFAYHQHRTGQLDENVWEWLDYEIPVFLSSPGLAVWWARDKARFSKDSVQFVDRRLAEPVRPQEIPTMGSKPS